MSLNAVKWVCAAAVAFCILLALSLLPKYD